MSIQFSKLNTLSCPGTIAAMVSATPGLQGNDSTEDLKMRIRLLSKLLLAWLVLLLLSTAALAETVARLRRRLVGADRWLSGAARERHAV